LAASLFTRLPLSFVPQYRLARAADLLGVSDDSVRRFIDAGELSAIWDTAGRRVVDGAELAKLARRRAVEVPDPTAVRRSARNQFVGLVTEVLAEGAMAQVDVQCGPNRLVSLMSSEAVREMGLEPGVLAVAVVKSTDVRIDIPAGNS
jgi:molybdopterin-binding protein